MATREIPLTKGYVAIVDEADYARLSAYRWQAFTPGGRRRAEAYATRRERVGGVQHTIRMHRQITGAPDGLVVDHINGNGLDNRRRNLRICTVSDNAKNRLVAGRSGLKGVCFHQNRYQAKIKLDGKSIYLGRFRTGAEAAAAYDRAARELFGEFALTNAGQRYDAV